MPTIRIELMTLSLLVIRSTTEPSGRCVSCQNWHLYWRQWIVGRGRWKAPHLAS
ncbi:hypothetical protein BD289DRAFT_433296 [Coniella lustricola]|uniref:Uncharacterized protein n=1 Tax=Coniella lustricola TaxID=2025994 RepID=A0A2T3A8X4_9PEZI|nr:hypothetical protein BD289DRAFT_433296 [Coniella lustricola]